MLLFSVNYRGLSFILDTAHPDNLATLDWLRLRSRVPGFEPLTPGTASTFGSIAGLIDAADEKSPRRVARRSGTTTRRPYKTLPTRRQLLEGR